MKHCPILLSIAITLVAPILLHAQHGAPSPSGLERWIALGPGTFSSNDIDTAAPYHSPPGRAGVLDRVYAAGVPSKDDDIINSIQLHQPSPAPAGQPVFIVNRGQWDRRAAMLARWKGLDMWVENNAITYDLYNDAGVDGSGNGTGRRSGHVVRMRFENADKDARAYGLVPTAGVHNYFLGRDRSRWAVNVPLYQRAEINGIYPGVAAALYVDGGQPRYDLVVSPGTDPSQIRIACEGATSVSVGAQGQLLIGTSLGTLEQRGLYAYQRVGNDVRSVPCSFTVNGGKVGFAVGAYDASRPLVIDPILYSTLIAADGYCRGHDLFVDKNNSVYITGYTGSATYPVSLGAYQGAINGANLDAFVTKLGPDGATLQYSTYIGGGTDDIGTSLTVDAGGMVYLAGYTFSGDFPTKNAYSSTHGGGFRDAFVAKFDPLQNTPAAQLVYSTFLGGDGFDYALGIAVRGGEAYVTGYTSSTAFPVSGGAFQTDPVYQAGVPSGEAFISRLSASGSTLIASTLFGADRNDAGAGITFDGAGNVYIAGLTRSTNLPTNGPTQAFDTTANGGADAFVAKFPPTLTTLLYSTYLGGTGNDQANAIAVDAAGNMFVTGATSSSDFPTVLGSVKTTFNGMTDIFITKIPPAGSPLSYSTYLGGNNLDVAYDLALDGDGNAWVAGASISDNFPASPNAIQPVKAGSYYDAVLAEVNSSGTRLLYGSYLGGSASSDTATAIAVGADGNVFVAGSTFSSDFPKTPGAFRSTGIGGAFVTKVGIMHISTPVGGEIYCAGESVQINWAGTAANQTYDLYVSADSGKNFVPIAFSLSGTSYTWFAPPGLAAGTAYRIKITVGNGNESDLSGVFTINAPPHITAHPVSTSVAPGNTATFTVAGTGTPTPSIQWQEKSGSTWTDLRGETKTVLKLLNVSASMNGNRYRALFANTCRVISSDSALLTVPSIHLEAPNGGETFCAGEVDTIRWQSIANNGLVSLSLSSDGGSTWSSFASGISKNYYAWKIPADLAGDQFRIRAELLTVPTLDVCLGNFTINQAAHVKTGPTDKKGSVDGSVSFSAEGTGRPAPSIQWLVNPGTGWMPIQTAVGRTLTINNLTLDQNGWRYRAVFTNGCGTDSTAPAVLTVTLEPTGVPVTNSPRAAAFALHAVPNPMGGDGRIMFTLPRSGHVAVLVRDLRGRIVAHPFEGQLAAGAQSVPITTSALASGAYFVELVSGTERSTIEITVAH